MSCQSVRQVIGLVGVTFDDDRALMSDMQCECNTVHEMKRNETKMQLFTKLIPISSNFTFPYFIEKKLQRPR
jgi:hypothetical protein